MGLSRVPDPLLPAFAPFEILAKGRFEAYGQRLLSGIRRAMGPRLTNSGRKVAIEAAMIPRFISSLTFMSAVVTRELGSWKDPHGESGVDEIVIWIGLSGCHLGGHDVSRYLQVTSLE